MKKAGMYLRFIIFISILLFPLILMAGTITLNDGRVLSGLIKVSATQVTIRGNQGFYQIPKSAVKELKLDANDSDEKSTMAAINTNQTKGKLAVIETNLGTIRCELFPAAAPETVKNFVTLAKEGFFENIIFHRVIPNFMIQVGNPQFRLKPTTKQFPIKQFADEINASALGLDKILVKNANLNIPKDIVQRFGDKTLKELYEMQGYKYSNSLPSLKMKRGMLAMANAGPNTNSTQFFITVADCFYLDGKHTVFGEVISGFDIAEKISRVQTKNDKPIQDVYIKTIKIIEQ